MTNKDQCREAFEAWARSLPENVNLTREGGGYRYAYAECFWEAWQAARSATTTGMPAGWVPVPVEPTPEMCEADWDISLSDAHTNHGVERCFWAAMLAAAPKLPLGDGWLPIESAPKNQLVMVYSPPQNDDHPEAIRIEFDYIDAGIADGYWYAHGESYEHFCCVAKPEGCTGPSEKAPYTHWMPLPPPPKEQGS